MDYSTGFFKKKVNVNEIYGYKEVKNVDIVEDAYTSKGGIFVEEMCNMLGIRIQLKNNTYVGKKLITSKTKKSGWMYKVSIGLLSEIKEFFDEIIQSNNKEEKDIDIPNEVSKYKKLLDEGAITQKEFDSKKKQLLDL